MSAARAWKRPARTAVRAGFMLVAAAAVLASAWLAAVLVSGEFPGRSSGEEGWTTAAVVAAAIVAAALWPLARAGARRAAERLMHGAARSPDDVVRSFGRRSSRSTPDSELLVQLVESLVQSYRAASAEIWRDDGSGRLTRRVSIPHRHETALDLDPAARRVLAGGGVVGRAWLEMWQPDLLADRPLGEVRVAPATHAGRLLGLIVVTRLPSAVRFTPAEDASLAELGVRLGVLLHNRELDAALQSSMEDLRLTNAELRASRVRLVATADGERRRIERNLHDGAQQHLVALAVNLKVAESQAASDPAAVPEVFAQLGRDLKDAIDELRALAHGIYPPVLLDAGIVEALRASARRIPSPVSVHAEGVGRYPTDVEAALYFCCMEALQNAAKHAPGAAVRVQLSEDDGAVRFVVEDDGPGLGPSVGAGVIRHGHGLGNMVDRTGAVGGTIEVGRSASGGARIVGTVPVDGGAA
jgi:signal transduction histidine kinase